MAWSKWKAASMAALLSLTVIAAGCGSNNGNNGGGGNAETNGGNNGTAQTDANGSNAGEVGTGDGNAAAADGPLTKYDPPITVTTVRSVNAGVKFAPGDSYDSNKWTKDFESQLGITVKNLWKVSDQQYQNKVTVTIASGDLPDFMLVDAQQFQTLAKSGDLADLTDVFDKYATDLTKQSLDEADGIKRKAGMVDGKLYGIAANGGGRDDAHSIFIRKDWLDNLGLQPPKTMDDVINIAMAFTKDDPDRNGKDDTYGLSVDQNLFGGWSGLDGFFNGYHAYPFNPTKGSGTNLIFLKGADGKTQYADIQPEVKTALGKLQELFKAGAIYPEFSVIDGVKSGELATSGKVGMSFGAFYVPTWPINNMKKDNPNVEWGIYPLVSADDQPVKAQSTGVPSQFYVVSKKAEHPEAPIKLSNYVNEKLFGPNKDMSYHTVDDGNGNSYGLHMYPPISGYFADKNQDYFYQVKDALAKQDPSGLDAEAKQYYDQVQQYKGGDLTLWSADKLWDEGSVFDVIGSYKKEGRIVTTAYLGAPTPTLLSRGSALRDLEAKAFTEIIMGTKPLDSFDEFVSQWKTQGGDQILKEIDDSGLVQ